MEGNKDLIFYYSAPGKAIISGEHSVVYYKNALVMALDLRTYCKLTLSKKQNDSSIDHTFIIENNQDSRSLIQITDIQLKQLLEYLITLKEEIDFSTLQKQFPLVEEKDLILSYLFLSVFMEIYGRDKSIEDTINAFDQKISKNNLIKINLHSTLPISKGLGSSASYFTALSASLTKMFMHLLEVKELSEGYLKFVNKIAFNFEKIYHGTPSGIDNYIATYGNLLVFNKNYTNSLQIGKLPYKIFLIDSQVEKSTKKAVGRVREIYDDESIGKIGKQTIDMIGDVTDNIIKVFNQNNFDKSQFENLIRINQSLLRLLDLSHSSIEDIMSICMKYEIAAKITGAGQGGNCIAFVPETYNQSREREFIQELESHGYQIIFATLSQQGVKEETTI
ncbi:mevalonate kinase (macronuclear) [Tetrahymena thermophila SB210]|uniref:Mevalonate kinase n=1 Tax=Tetrahymena thermophila (strain SB210) TaxID=312017 RepID=Q22HD5_TETTS|nr:mevalonate kinase [Tetrahymena thermophila SB210]EAR84766.3 mevalonate kinase [Tetrahymena thermophila SB210]|eukprot:XP_001032429.3 mevalonate kinase [Tetrahymena thermophila SB210]